MKITKTYLKQIIKEEIAKIKEGHPGGGSGAASRRELEGYERHVAKMKCKDQDLCFDEKTNDCKDCEDSRPLEEADETEAEAATRKAAEDKGAWEQEKFGELAAEEGDADAREQEQRRGPGPGP